MSAIEDLNQAVANIAVSVSVEIDALKSALSVVGQDAAIEASVAKLNSLNDALKASVTPAVVAPVPAVDPTPTSAAPAA